MGGKQSQHSCLAVFHGTKVILSFIVRAYYNPADGKLKISKIFVAYSKH